MKLHLLLISVLAGVVFGKKLECLSKELSLCVQDLDLTSLSGANGCSKYDTLKDCYESSSNKCKDDAPEAVRKALSISRDLCSGDSQLLKELEQYIPCVNNAAFMKNFIYNCRLSEYFQGFQELGTPDMENFQEFSDKLMNFICPKRGDLVHCGYAHIKAACGEKAENFFHKMVDPVDEIMQEACGDTGSVQSISIALILLQFLIVMFSSRSIF